LDVYIGGQISAPSFDAEGHQQFGRELTGGRTTTTWNCEKQPQLYKLPVGGSVEMPYNADLKCLRKEN
jgi:hypothetical protein